MKEHFNFCTNPQDTYSGCDCCTFLGGCFGIILSVVMWGSVYLACSKNCSNF